jgi:glycosyltransferase involved in cell wall biosynthesis
VNIALSTTVIQRGKTGVAQYVLSLVRALLPHASQHRFTLFVLEEDRPLLEFAAGAMTILPVAERYRSALRNIWWHQAVLPGLLRERQIDVCHVPSYRRLLWPKPCALVASIHDLAQFHVRGKYDWARMFYGRVVARRLAQRQDAIIAVSQNTARDIEQFFGIPVARQHVILNGIDQDRFQPGDRARAKQQLAERWQQAHPFFLYVSRLEHPAKNHVRLIEAFSQFKTATNSDRQLVLVGCDWHGAEAIHAAAMQSPFSGDIRFLGFIDNATLPALYQAADALVYPSLFEGFGFPPVEAMACGCPVISSARGALAEVVADAADIIDPLDVSGLAAALRRVTTDAGHCDRLRAAGLRNAQRFNWQRNAEAVLGVYEAAVARRKTAHGGRRAECSSGHGRGQV